MVVDSFQDITFVQFDSFVKSHKEYVNDYEILDGMYIVYIFNVPKDFKQDYSKFLYGSYSLMSEEAQNLTKALKGDSKAQGNWGEMVLKKLLDLAGLEEGREYQTEVSFTEAGKQV